MVTFCLTLSNDSNLKKEKKYSKIILPVTFNIRASASLWHCGICVDSSYVTDIRNVGSFE